MKKISDKKLLKDNTIALMIIQILNYVLPFLTLPYIARIFRVADYGVIFFASIMMDYFWRFILFGFDLSAVRQIAVHCNNKKSINYIFNTVMFIQIIFLIIGFIILNIIILSFPKFSKDYIIYNYTYLGLVGSVFCCSWFYQGITRMKFITILNIIIRLISLILIFTCIKKADDYLCYPLINSASAIIAGIISIIFVKKYFEIKLYIPKLKSILNSIKYSSQFFITKIGIALYRSTNAFILGLAVTSVAVAYYVAAEKIFWSVLGLYFTFVNALFPYMSKNKDIKFFKKILKYLIALAISVSILLFIMSKWLILIFYSAKYIDAVKILQIFSLSFAFYIFVDTLGMPLLGAFGYIKETNTGYIIGGLYNVIGLGILYFFQNINIVSVAILVSSTYIIMFLHRIYYVNKYDLLK